jgi:predicted RNase H-like HicB family nuclease
MVTYPIDMLAQGDGTYRVVAPHFPEFEAFGDTEDDALMHACFALEEVISERMAKRQVVPVPLKAVAAGRVVTLSSVFADMLESYWKYNIGTFPPDRRA